MAGEGGSDAGGNSQEMDSSCPRLRSDDAETRWRSRERKQPWSSRAADSASAGPAALVRQHLAQPQCCGGASGLPTRQQVPSGSCRRCRGLAVMTFLHYAGLMNIKS